MKFIEDLRNHFDKEPLKHGFRLSFLGIGLGVLIVILLTALSASKGPTAKDCSDIVPPGWKPSLEQVETYIDYELNANKKGGQHFLNQASQNIADLRDAQLFIIYVFLMQTLDANERADLFNDQKQWLIRREKMARAAVVSKRGSLEPLEYSGAFRKITEERLITLEKLLAQKRAASNVNHHKEEKKV
jgi:uncharacterized protein YecT (DUF1311 family)